MVLGEQLTDVTVDNGVVVSVKVNIDGKTMDFMDKIAQANYYSYSGNRQFYEGIRFYLRGTDTKYPYITVVNELLGKFQKKSFHLATGDLIMETEYMVSPDNLIIRNTRGKEITINQKDHSVLLERKEIELPTISKRAFFKKKKYTKGTRY